MNNHIFHYIMSYLHRPQSKELLYDIENYYYCKKEILNIYKKSPKINNNYQYWLFFDLFIYYCDHPKMKKKFSYKKNNLPTQINFILAILLPKDRLEFMLWINY